MHADIQGALAFMKRGRFVPLVHKGKTLSRKEALKVLRWADSKGYESTSQIKDEEVDKLLNYKPESHE